VKIRIIKWSNVLLKCERDEVMLRAFEDFRRRLKFAEGSSNPHDLIASFRNSDLVSCPKLKESRIVFNIGSNKYRMICGYLFKKEVTILFIKFVGTHSEYDKVHPCRVDMFK